MLRPEEPNISDLLVAVNRYASALEASTADMEESNRVADHLIDAVENIVGISTTPGSPEWGQKVLLCRNYFRLSRCGANGEPGVEADLVDRLVWSLLTDAVFKLGSS
jgi:hypothetical protein